MSTTDFSWSSSEEPLSPARTEGKRLEQSIRETYRGDKGYVCANSPSIISAEDLAMVREQYRIPEQYEMKAPHAGDKMYFRHSLKFVSVHTQALKYGLRFPLHDFINTFFTLTGISLSQLLPNSYIYLVTFIAFCHDIKVTPAVDFFFSLFSLTKTKEPGFRCLNKLPGKKALVQTPTTNKGWHPLWFYIYGSDTIQIPSWGEPRKLNLGSDRLSAPRLKEFEEFCQKIPSEPRDLELLSNNQWLYDHGCKYLN